MALTVSQLRSLENAETAYILFIEGFPYAWVTDHPNDALLGWSSNSWMGQSEAAIGLPEATGQRRVLPGLKVPGDIELGNLNLSTGLLDATSATFEIVDHGGELKSLFSYADADYDVVSESIQAGTTSLDDSLVCQGSVVVDPHGKYIDLEKIGPNGQRRQFPPFPFQLPGFQHVPGTGDENGPAPVSISEQPIAHAGRLVALYRLYRDTSSSSTGYTSWPYWPEQYEAGGLVWWGTLTDRGTLKGDRVWSLSCRGPDSLLRRQIGTLTPSTPFPVLSAALSLPTTKRVVSVVFRKEFSVDYLGNETLPALYDYLDTNGGQRLSEDATYQDYVSELNTIIRGVLDGTLTNVSGDGGTADQMLDAGIHNGQGVYIRAVVEDRAPKYMDLGAHELVWKLLGYEPAVQRALAESDEHYVQFETFTERANYPDWDGYWVGRFRTYQDDASETVPMTKRLWPAPYPAGVAVLTKEGGQKVSTSVGHVFIEGQKTVPYSSDSSVNGSACDKARYFAFKGLRAVGNVSKSGQIKAENGALVDDIEAEDFVQVARVSWRESGAGYGSVAEEDGSPTFVIEQWVDPASFGFPYKLMDGDWAFVPGELEMWPLSSWAYSVGAGGTDELENASSVLSQILLSSGTASGYGSALENAPDFSTGSNDSISSYKFSQLAGGDCELADLGLGVPSQLVAGVSQLRAAYNEAAPDMSRVRYAYRGGPRDSYQVLASLITPRGLMMSLRGRQYGVTELAPFPLDQADMEITEDDLLGRQGDPGSLRPRQQLKAVGSLDRTTFRYDWNPIEDATSKEQVILSQDPGARHRRGDLQFEVEEHGLRSFGGEAWTMWAKKRPEFYAARHFLVTSLTVSRIKGQDIHVGTRVLLTNPWIVSPVSDGYEGVTKAAGIVTSVSLNGADHTYSVKVMIFAGQFGEGFRYFCPVGRIRRVTGTTVELYSDSEFLAHGDGSDASRMWVEPSWSELGGNAQVAILEFDRASWTLSNLAEVQSVDADTNTLTLAAPFQNTVLRDTDKFLVMLGADDQGAAWVQQLGLPVVLDTHKYGSGPTKGSPFNDKKKP